MRARTLLTLVSLLPSFFSPSSDRANDGNTDTNCNGQAGQILSSQTTWNLCTGTLNEAEPWWRVDLGSVQPIAQLKLWGRTDCCVDRIDGFAVYTSNVDNFATAKAAGACPNRYFTVPDPPAIIDMTAAARCALAEFVWVSLPRGGLLSLIEVQVLKPYPWVWRQQSGLAEVAQGKPATQSSTELCCAGGDPNRAVDGDTSQNNYNFGSCSHTADNALQALDAAWWQVDLGAAYDVSEVIVWPRTDCCNTRNTRVVISLGQSTNMAFDSNIVGVPANIGPNAGLFNLPFQLPTPVRSRFVTISRTYLAGDDNILAVSFFFFLCVCVLLC